MSHLNFAGIGLSILFFVLILTKKEKKTTDYLLSFFIFLLGTYLLIKYIFENELVAEYPVIIIIDFLYWTLMGPTLFVYTVSMSRGYKRIPIRFSCALIPAIIVLICFSEYIFFSPIEFLTIKASYPFYEHIGYVFWLYNSPVFYILTIIELYKHKKRIKGEFSSTTKKDLKWLNYLTHGFLIFLLFIFLRPYISSFFEMNSPIQNYNISILVVIIYIFGIGFYGYKQRGIFENHVQPDYPDNMTLGHINFQLKENSSESRYQKSGLNLEESNLILEKLKNVMEKEELFLDSELDLSALSEKINVSNHKISQVINNRLQKNFFDFVNEYRISKVKQLLADSSYNHFSIAALACDSGFNSKSTFYNLFKKIENKTPAEYRMISQQKVG